MSYVAPVREMLFVLKELATLEEIARLSGFEDAGLETAQAIPDESARICEEVLAPLNAEGGRHPSVLIDLAQGHRSLENVKERIPTASLRAACLISS